MMFAHSLASDRATTATTGAVSLRLKVRREVREASIGLVMLAQFHFAYKCDIHSAEPPRVLARTQDEPILNIQFPKHRRSEPRSG